MKDILKMIIRNWRGGLRTIVGLYFIFIGFGLILGFDTGIPLLSSLLPPVN